jgi:hypothetical protein
VILLRAVKRSICGGAMTQWSVVSVQGTVNSEQGTENRGQGSWISGQGIRGQS